MTTRAGGATAAGTLTELDPTLQRRIVKALEECADEARSAVLVSKLDGRSPTKEECDEVVKRDGKGQPVTRAMWLGVEMHEVALKCAEQRLSELRPGGFSVSPRYRHDARTNQVEWIPPEEEKALKHQGKWAELRGTLVPDVVIHQGDPLRAEAVYDFKFPCVNGTETPWRNYPMESPHHGSTQGKMYRNALGVQPVRILPRLGARK